MTARFEAFTINTQQWGQEYPPPPDDPLKALCALATAFASEIGPDRVISISLLEQSCTAVVWYWADHP